MATRLQMDGKATVIVLFSGKFNGVEDSAVERITVAMQAKNYPTANQLLPGIDAVLLATHKDTPVRMPDGVILNPQDLHAVTFAAREAMHVDLVDRFVTKMPEADLRFFSIATLLDPTMKNWGWPGCRRECNRSATIAMKGMPVSCR